MKRFRQKAIFIFALLGLGMLSSAVWGASISGDVTDANSGTAIEGAMILAIGSSPAGGDSLFYFTQSQPDGSYLIDNMQAGVYMLFASHPMYVRGTQGPLTLEPTTQLTNIDFQLVPFNNSPIGTISGNVTFDSSGNPVAGAILEFIPQNGGTIEFSITDIQGNYMADVPVGDYVVACTYSDTFWGESIYREYYDDVQNINLATIVTVTENNITPNIDFGIPDSIGAPIGDATLSGYVWEDDTTQNIPVHPAFIELIGQVNPTGAFYRVWNNPDGSYNFDNIQSGTYDILCHAPGYEDQYIFDHVIQPGANTLDFYLTALTPLPFGSISGTVVTDSAGSPVAGALIEFLSLSGNVVHMTVSDFQGNYLANIPAGDYYVSCTVGDSSWGQVYREYYDDVQSLSQATVVTVMQNSLTDNINFGIPANIGPTGDATLSGFVFEDDTLQNTPVYPAFLELYGGNSGTTNYYFYRIGNNPDGSYLFENVVSGIYTLICTAPNFQPKIITDLVINSGSNNLDIYLTPFSVQPTGSISGTVVFDGSGDPVEDAFLEFISQNGGIGGWTVTDSAGNYFADIPVGDYIVSLTYRFPGWNSYFYQEFYDDVHTIGEATIVTVTENNTTNGIDFGIPDSISIGNITNVTVEGNVADNSGQPLENALVTVYALRHTWPGGTVGNDSIYTGYTDAQGNFSINITSNSVMPFMVLIASAEKSGYLIEFWQEKPAMPLADPILVFGDTLIQDIDFTLDPETTTNNSISGTITDDSTGAAIQGAFVIGSNAFSSEIVFTFTDAQGYYILDGLDAAPHFLLFAADGHVPEFYDDVYVWEDATPVFASGAVTGIDAGLAPFNPSATTGMIAGMVKDNTGVGLSGVLLTIQNNAGDVIGYDFTNGQGSYEITGLSYGDYTVHASKVNYASGSQQVQYTTGSMVVNFNLPQSPSKLNPKDETVLPEKVELEQNYPNPFNPVTTIRFALPESQHTNLVIYNILGQSVKELVNENLAAGRYEITWNGTDRNGKKVASGIYFYSLELDETKLIQKMLLTK